MTIQIRSITLKVFLIISFGLTPIWVVFPSIIGAQTDNRTLGIALSVILLAVTIIFAHKYSSRTTELTITDKEVSFRKTTFLIQNIQSIVINKTGIGMSAIEFYLKTGKKYSLNVPNSKGNADLAISFVKNNLPEIETSDKGYY